MQKFSSQKLFYGVMGAPILSIPRLYNFWWRPCLTYWALELRLYTGCPEGSRGFRKPRDLSGRSFFHQDSLACSYLRVKLPLPPALAAFGEGVEDFGRTVWRDLPPLITVLSFPWRNVCLHVSHKHESSLRIQTFYFPYPPFVYRRKGVGDRGTMLAAAISQEHFFYRRLAKFFWSFW